ncbi:jg6567 [Pararge aegeria aegeria]|uniref:Jg6567 protein n=1 Tax=Pararge aegeria aegeria TaxID=348720 RepID=A0A8S4QW21_9NEOP|nr:jg6567 [Pararge aegeria aegeria]
MPKCRLARVALYLQPAIIGVASRHCVHLRHRRATAARRRNRTSRGGDASSPFAPRASLARTPPGSVTVESPTVPPRKNRSPPGKPPVTMTRGKGPLTSPEERRPSDKVRLCRPATPARVPSITGATLRPGPPQSSRPATPEAEAAPTGSDHGGQEGSPMLSRASKLELLTGWRFCATKAELKRAVNPRVLDVQIAQVRKLGNAGVVVQTTSPSDADRLRNAAPATLRVSEPKKVAPKVRLRGIDGNPKSEEVLLALHDQNLRFSSDWSLEKLRAQTKIFKKNGRFGTTTVVLECPPDLLNKERVFIGWQAVEVCERQVPSLRTPRKILQVEGCGLRKVRQRRPQKRRLVP